MLEKDGRTGRFTTAGVYLAGDNKTADPQLCGWIGGSPGLSYPCPEGFWCGFVPGVATITRQKVSPDRRTARRARGGWIPLPSPGVE